MKTIKKKEYKTVYEEKEYEITNVIHNLPTWMFPPKMLCPVCHHEMRMQIGHGEYIETCSMIQLDNWDTYPIHRDCYDKLKEK